MGMQIEEHWVYCRECGGSGHTWTGGDCRACDGAGEIMLDEEEVQAMKAEEAAKEANNEQE